MSNLILTGFSGAGKSAVGRAAAALLGWSFVDVDAEVVHRTGKPVAAVFAEQGEAAFRRLEAEALAEACSRGAAVIATGGGAITDAANRELMLRSGVVVCLEARTDTILERLFGEQGADEAEVRPLLQDPSPRDRIDGLKAQRQPAYALAHWTVHTDGLNVDEVAREVVRAWDLLRGKSTDGDHSDDALAAVVHSSAGACPIYVGWGLLDELGQRCRRVGLSTTAYLVSDETVFRRYGRRAQAALEAADIPTHTLTLPAGETSKTLEMAGVCYGWLAERRAGRRHFIVALGGGVVGDLAGFVAATFNRGMPFVQVPTSLAAMVDASIGGKTAVDLPQGKNLVGAFHQPRFTLAEMDTLTTLSPREMAAGWAEAIKHGLILDADLLQTFEEHAEAVQALETPLATDIVRRSTAIKADVVSRDERETLGVRALLNYGHTLGHALEAATGYAKLLHGEAVAVGMTAAVRISRDMGLIGQDVVDRQDRLLERFGLPIRCPGVDRETVRRAMGVDKKAVDGTLRWVLLEDVGRATLRADVPSEVVEAALQEVT